MRYSNSYLLALSAATLLLLSAATPADDFVMPDWDRFGSFSIVQEWEFESPGPIAPDGELPTFNPGVLFVIASGDLGWLEEGPFDLSGYLAGTGGFLLFEVPNIPDGRPVKHLQIQINGVWVPGFEPTVIDLVGFVFPDTFVPGVFVDSDETCEGFHRVEDWDIFPNLDFEELLLFIPPGSFVNQVVIDTISAIPVPAALPLLLSGLAFLGGGLNARRVTMA